MNYATQDDIDSKKDDIVTSHGVTVLVDPKAIFFIVGTVMDFVVSFKNHNQFIYYLNFVLFITGRCIICRIHFQ